MINVAYGLIIEGDVNPQSGVVINGNVTCKCGFSLSGDLICAPGSQEIPDYDGPYTVTPTLETQTLLTQNKKTTNNITIVPIPSNYGLITWNGSYLKVS